MKRSCRVGPARSTSSKAAADHAVRCQRCGFEAFYRGTLAVHRSLIPRRDAGEEPCAAEAAALALAWLGRYCCKPALHQRSWRPSDRHSNAAKRSSSWDAALEIALTIEIEVEVHNKVHLHTFEVPDRAVQVVGVAE